MKTRFTFTLDAEVVERFRAACIENGRDSMSSTINLFMKAYTGYDDRTEVKKYLPSDSSESLDE